MYCDEIRILDWIQTFRTPLGDSLMCLITGIGNAGIIWIVLTCVLLLIPKTRKYGMVVLAALVLDMVLCNGILKPLVGRARPFTANPSIQLLVSKPADYSFPSGHTAAAFAAVSALFFAGEKKIWKGALVLAVLITFSRLYLYVHYPTDVLGGAVVGAFAAWGAVRIVKHGLVRKAKKAEK